MLALPENDGTERVVYYLSQILNDAETRYTPLEKLCLSLLYVSIYQTWNRKLKLMIFLEQDPYVEAQDPILEMSSLLLSNPLYWCLTNQKSKGELGLG